MARTTVYPFGPNGTLPSALGIINDMRTGGADQVLSAEVGKEIGDILGEYKILESSFSGFDHYKDGYQLKADSTQVGKNIDDVGTYQSAIHFNVKIPLDGIASLSFHQYGSGYDFGSLFVDANGIVLKGVVVTTGTIVELDVPIGAAYLIYSYTTSVYDKTVTLYAAGGLVPTIAEMTEKAPSGLVTAKSPDLVSGKVGEYGAPIANSAYVTTETIFGEFFLQLAEGWRVYEGHLYDRSGKIVAYQHIHPDVAHTGARGVWSSRKFMSTSNAIPEFGLRLTFCKTDQSVIVDGEQPVTNFVLLSESGLHRWIPDDLPNYERALRRVDYLEHLTWVPLAKVPNGYSESGQPENEANKRFCIAGRRAVGVPYSDVAGTRKYVPNNVSLRTFMTAVKNRRSLLYTEELGNNTSKYGMTYTSGHRRAYYGEVCCGLTAWVMGLDLMYLAGQYGANNVTGLSSVTYNSVNDLRPLDLVWQEGHISIITDIWKDEFGNVKYIAWAEMSTPYPYRTLYTPEQFDTRITSTSATVHRWNGWANLPEPEATEYSQYLLGETRKEPKVNDDIMCFAGDYAAFAEGDTIYLNARRNFVYTGVELYKDDVLLQTIDITGLSADTIVTPNTEDWVAVNLTTLSLTYGKYKARLTDGENTTDYTYFEVIGITMSATKSGNNVIVAFSANGGTPVTIEQVKANGFPSSPNGKYHDITAEEVAAGSMTLGWSYNSTYKYLLMLVKGDYGTVPKMISQPSA